MPVDQTASVHAAITLTTEAQTVTTAITAPTTARALSVTGTKAGATLTGTVTLTGTDQYGQTVTATYALSGSSTVHAATPQDFATVTSIIVPARTTAGDTVEVGYQDALFDIPSLRAFGKGLITAAAFADAVVTAKEAEIREFFEADEVCGVAFLPRVHREYLDGTGTRELFVTRARPLAVTACVIYDSEMTVSETFDATDLADIAIDEVTGRIVRRTEGTFTLGERNVLITYLHGHRTVPEMVRRGALQIAETELPATNVPYGAESYEDGGVPVTFAVGDGFQRNWHRLPDVRKAIRAYGAVLPGIV